jgi:hypothetical protein
MKKNLFFVVVLSLSIPSGKSTTCKNRELKNFVRFQLKKIMP